MTHDPYGSDPLVKPEPYAESGRVTIESEMERLSINGRFAVQVEIVNAGQEGAQFFAAEIAEHAWIAAVAKPPRIRWHYGYGSGTTILEALASCEKTALGGHGHPGYPGEHNDGGAQRRGWGCSSSVNPVDGKEG